jgi:hypothetical protein
MIPNKNQPTEVGRKEKRKMKTLKELKKEIEKIEITYDYDASYTNLLNTTIDYMNDSQDFELESLFEDFIDYEIAEDRAKYELEQGGLIRLYYYLNNANLNNNIFKINGYGNLEDININDLKNLKEEILDNINNQLESEVK